MPPRSEEGNWDEFCNRVERQLNHNSGYDCRGKFKWKHEPPVIRGIEKTDEGFVFKAGAVDDLCIIDEDVECWRLSRRAPVEIDCTPNKMYFKYALGEKEKNKMHMNVKTLNERVAANVNVFFNKNFVITKPRNYKEASPDKFELPEDISAEENKFGAFCHAIVAIYMRECSKVDNFVIPIDKYVDPKSHKATVRFSDGMDVSCEPTGDDRHLAAKTNDYFAQDICYAKKILGSTSAIRKCLEACDVAERRKKAKEHHKELDRKINEEKRKYEKQMFEDDVKRKMNELRIEREASRRLNEEEWRNTRVPSQE